MRFVYALLFINLLVRPAFCQKTTDARLAQASKERRAILQTLQRQTDDWNAGRIERFMSAYNPSDSLTFVNKAGITYGYSATLDNYKKRYPDRESMGKLRFEVLELDLLSPTLAYVVGKFYLNRPTIGNADGYFTLLWRKIRNRWVIISDHTSQG